MSCCFVCTGCWFQHVGFYFAYVSIVPLFVFGAGKEHHLHHRRTRPGMAPRRHRPGSCRSYGRTSTDGGRPPARRLSGMRHRLKAGRAARWRMAPPPCAFGCHQGPMAVFRSFLKLLGPWTTHERGSARRPALLNHGPFIDRGLRPVDNPDIGRHRQKRCPVHGPPSGIVVLRGRPLAWARVDHVFGWFSVRMDRGPSGPADARDHPLHGPRSVVDCQVSAMHNGSSHGLSMAVGSRAMAA